MHDDDSPFLAVPTSEWLAANDHAFAIADRFRLAQDMPLWISEHE